MDSVDKWSTKRPDREDIHQIWEHEKSDDRIRVEQFDDGTWDTFLNERLIENFDDPEEAVERARRLMDAHG
ncbi:MAG: hypothetical protein ABEJ36_04710 [Candidatus Nanosalina sp.]